MHSCIHYSPPASVLWKLLSTLMLHLLSVQLRKTIKRCHSICQLVVHPHARMHNCTDIVFTVMLSTSRLDCSVLSACFFCFGTHVITFAAEICLEGFPCFKGRLFALQMLRPMLPPEPQAKTRPAPLATFEAASALLESDLRWDRVAERDRYMLSHPCVCTNINSATAKSCIAHFCRQASQ